MDLRFWLLQSIGWLAFTLLQLVAEPADAPVSGAPPEFLAVALTALAVVGSLALRHAYRHAQAARFSELQMLVLVAAFHVQSDQQHPCTDPQGRRTAARPFQVEGRTERTPPCPGYEM